MTSSLRMAAFIALLMVAYSPSSTVVSAGKLKLAADADVAEQDDEPAEAEETSKDSDAAEGDSSTTAAPTSAAEAAVAGPPTVPPPEGAAAKVPGAAAATAKPATTTSTTMPLAGPGPGGENLRTSPRTLRNNKFIVVSAPRKGLVSYTKINGDGTVHPLIERGLTTPQGLCMDNTRRYLYVADPGARKIWMFHILFQNGWLLTDGSQTTVVQNVESRWVDVDTAGNLFFTDEGANTVLKVDEPTLRSGHVATPKSLYNGMDVTTVSSPGGIAADNYNLFWTNKVMGDAVGSVIKGLENPPETGEAAPTATALCRNSAMSYGLCLTSNNIFFLAPKEKIFAIKKNGGAIATVSNTMVEPRGCTWDLDGTVFVTDRAQAGGTVWSFPGNMQQLGMQNLVEVAVFEDAFGIAMISGTMSRLLTTRVAVLLSGFVTLMCA